MDDNVTSIGGGGLLYEDARRQARRPPPYEDLTGEHMTPDAELPYAYLPDPPQAEHVPLPEPPRPERPPRDWPEIRSTFLELAGITCLTAGCWVLAPWVGLVVLGLSLILMGVAVSPSFDLPRLDRDT